ncbi:biotin/lipoyl-binding carrier protein [Actinosynnema sp.]|uniref:biotin/lipoyl-binding carrier protein n=1 Tax=Actinosynnema sp. TaxID=1872144 RepID=UPI003F858E7C
MARNVVVEVVAEMVANVMSVTCEVGEKVTPASTVLLLESMKMEIPVHPERAGTVREIKVSPGDVIQEGDVLVLLDPA